MTATPHGLPEDSDGPAGGGLLRHRQEEGCRPVRRWPRPWPWPLALSALTAAVSTTVLVSTASAEDPARAAGASLFGLVICVGAMLLVVLFAAVTPARPVDLVPGLRLEASDPSQAAGDDSVGMLVRRAAVHHAHVTAACWGAALLVVCWNAALLLGTVWPPETVDRLLVAALVLGIPGVLCLAGRARRATGRNGRRRRQVPEPRAGRGAATGRPWVR